MRLAPIFALALIACGDLIGADFDRAAQVDDVADAGPNVLEEAGSKPKPMPPVAKNPDGTCPVNAKRCGDICVQKIDPAYGCSSATCEPCRVPTSAVAICDSIATSCDFRCEGGGSRTNDHCVQWKSEDIAASDVSAVAGSSSDVYLVAADADGQKLLRRGSEKWIPLDISRDGSSGAMELNELFALPTGSVFGAASTSDGRPLLSGRESSFQWRSVGQGSQAPFNTLSSVWASDPNDIYVLCGTDLRHFDGNSWVSKHFEVAMFGLWGTDADHVYVMSGSGGVRLRSADGTWLLLPTLSSFAAKAIGGIGPNDFFVVGSYGAAVHYVDGNPVPVATNTDESLRAVWGSPSLGTWVVGTGGTVLHWTGTAFERPDFDLPSVAFEGVWGRGSDELYLVGRDDAAKRGIVLHRY